jgi:polyisoprenoid-binding protein YceI
VNRWISINPLALRERVRVREIFSQNCVALPHPNPSPRGRWGISRKFLHRLVALPFVLVSATSGASAVPTPQWRMDTAASRLTFNAAYQGQPAPGSFKQFDTKVQFDPTRLKESSLIVTVKLPSFDMGSSDINEAVRGPEWFDFGKFTDAEFKSQEIKSAGANRYVARGTLKLKGVQQTVDVPFTWKVEGKNATLAGDITLNRTTFGIGTGEWATGDPIGLDVKVSYSVRLQPGQ